MQPPRTSTPARSLARALAPTGAQRAFARTPRRHRRCACQSRRRHTCRSVVRALSRARGVDYWFRSQSTCSDCSDGKIGLRGTYRPCSLAVSAQPLGKHCALTMKPILLWPNRYGLYSYGLYGYGLYGCGLVSLCSDTVGSCGCTPTDVCTRGSTVIICRCLHTGCACERVRVRACVHLCLPVCFDERHVTYVYTDI